MKTTMKALGAAAMLTLSAGAASALTLNIADGGVGCESGGAGLSGCGGNTIGDIGQGFGADDINFAGSGTLLGFVADDKGTSSNYADGAVISLASASQLTLSIFNFGTGFDGTVSIGETLTSLTTFVVNAGNTTQVLGNFAAGDYFFKLDATTPTNSASRIDTNYSVEVSAVPLPASALLLLVGAGALAGMRRKSS